MKNMDTKDRDFMNMAKDVSVHSISKKRKVGAIIVKDGEVISSGFNRNELLEGVCETSKLVCSDCGCSVTIGELCCTWSTNVQKMTPTEGVLHAERDAIYNAWKKGNNLDGTTIYCTHVPCVSCIITIKESGISTVVYIEDERKIASLELLQKNGIETRAIN